MTSISIFFGICLTQCFAQLVDSNNNIEQSGIVSFSIPLKTSALIYSGPGSDYYPTGMINQGSEVEIFLRNEGGWCAIRPPQGCFSWISGQFVRVDYGKIGIVTTNNNEKEVPVRIGADSVLNSSVIQIGLKNGDKVQILGQTTLSNGKQWFKIAPPAGEFRWIHESLLTSDELISQLPDRLLTMEDYRQLIQKKNSVKSTVSQDFCPKQSESADHHSLLPDQQKKNSPDNQSVSGNDQGQQSPHSDHFSAGSAHIENGFLMTQYPEEAQSFSLQEKADNSENNQSQKPIQIIAERLKDQIRRPENPENAQNPFSPQDVDYKLPIWDSELMDDNFKFEVARLNRDLFLSVCKKAAPDVFELLEDRASTLFQVAQNDDQRYEVKKVWDSIQKYRRIDDHYLADNQSERDIFSNNNSSSVHLVSGSVSMNDVLSADQALFQKKESLDPFPVPNENGSNKISFERPVQTVSSLENNQDQSLQAKTSNRPSKLQFAFSESNNPFKNRKRKSLSSTENRNISSNLSTRLTTPRDLKMTSRRIPSLIPQTEGPQLVPPHDYQAVPQIMRNSSSSLIEREGGNQLPETKVDSKEPNVPSTFMAQKKAESNHSSEQSTELGWKSPDNIRQVIAVLTNEMPNNSDSVQKPLPDSNDWVDLSQKANIATWEVPAHILEKNEKNNRSQTNYSKDLLKENNSEKSVRLNSKHLNSILNAERSNAFDAIGILGYFPNRPEGFPVYALAKKWGDSNQIVCFVESEKNLDQFIGKTVGINGKEAIFNNGVENNRIITAKTIFVLQ
ncbi:MAG: SH3 domain-containing protein [Planctomycetia bacterium]|nr:SH3 domain-containing protein [Planctomycetia bacterium]